MSGDERGLWRCRELDLLDLTMGSPDDGQSEVRKGAGGPDSERCTVASCSARAIRVVMVDAFRGTFSALERDSPTPSRISQLHGFLYAACASAGRHVDCDPCLP